MKDWPPGSPPPPGSVGHLLRFADHTDDCALRIRTRDGGLRFCDCGFTNYMAVIIRRQQEATKRKRTPRPIR